MKDLPTPITSSHVDACDLNRSCQLGRDHIHLALLDDANRGWDDVESGRLLSVTETRAKYKKSKPR